MAKGIRVNQLAKELNVESKWILTKLRDEGLGDTAPNHMSVISLGLAESVREWFASSGGVATAVETAPPVEAKAKAAPARSRSKKKADGEAHDPHGSETPETAPAPSAPQPIAEVPAPTSQPVAPVAETPAPALEPVAEAPVVAPAAPVAPAPDVVAPPAPVAPAPAPVVVPPTTLKPAATMPAPVLPATPAPTAPHTPAIAPAAPLAPAAHHGGNAPLVDRAAPRPTVTLQSRLSQAQPHTPIRKAVTPAPMLHKPAPAVLKGPVVIREEKPENLPAPRPRRPMNDGPATAGGLTQARPQTGRGVKATEDDEEEKKKAAKKSGASNSSRRRGADGRRGEAEEKLREFTEADLIERRDRLAAASQSRAAFDSHLKKSSERGTHATARTAIQKGEPIEIEEPITVKTLSAALGVKSNELMGKLMKQGIFANINQTLDQAIAETLALDYGVELMVRQEATLEEELEQEVESRTSDDADLVRRPPVVTILGHVDHGKTSLLDRIRKANVAAGEAGGITQHTAAWKVTLGEGDKQKRVTFIDTPGHQAFTSMRARGANMTDVVVLVVSAAEGVQPQTIESINHARAAEVPIVVAMNKIDRPDANEQQILGQLAQNGLNPVEWGGDIEVIRTSATTGRGIEDLLEILDYQSELLDLKANPKAPAVGTVIESQILPGLGPVATVLVQDGTLKTGDVILAGPGYGRIRALLDDTGKTINEAGPSTPVIVSGFGELPSAGDKFYVIDDIDRARAVAEERATNTRQAFLAGANRVTTADTIFATIKANDVKTINLIIKADMQGSVETLVKTVGGQNTEEVKVRVIHSGVGAISESDVQLAMATRAKPTDNKVAIIGFHVTAEDTARSLAEQNHIDVKLYRVIYEIFDDLKKALSGMLSKEVREKIHGHVEIRQIIKVSKIGNIAGCMCTDGHIVRTDKVRLIRDGKIVTEGLTIDSLRRVKEDVREVKAGFECGVKLAGYDDIKIGDRLEAYITEEFERTL